MWLASDVIIWVEKRRNSPCEAMVILNKSRATPVIDIKPPCATQVLSKGFAGMCPKFLTLLHHREKHNLPTAGNFRVPGRDDKCPTPGWIRPVASFQENSTLKKRNFHLPTVGLSGANRSEKHQWKKSVRPSHPHFPTHSLVKKKPRWNVVPFRSLSP